MNWEARYVAVDEFDRIFSRAWRRSKLQNKQYYRDVSVLGNFLDNHDNPRFLSVNSDQNALKNALAYVIFAEVYIRIFGERWMSSKVYSFVIAYT